MDKIFGLAKEISDDNISGSSVILDKIIALLNLAQYGRFGLLSKEQLKKLIELLSQVDSSLRIVHHFLGNYLRFLDTSSDDYYQYIHNYHEQWKDVNNRIAFNLNELVSLNNKRILLHSNSGTVYQALKVLIDGGTNFEVVQTESRPMFEGREQAIKLARMGIRVDFVCDAAVGAEMANLDLCILGADVFTPSKFVNKIGSSAICCIADYYNKPVFVVSDSRKWSDNIDDVEHLRASEELWNESDPNIHIKNYYFESVDRSLISSLVHE